MLTWGFFAAVAHALESAPSATGREIDLTHVDYAAEPFDAGARIRVTSWSAYDKRGRPVPGDHLLLRNGLRSSRYRVIEVNNCWDVDPPTMFIAHAVFDPREA